MSAEQQDIEWIQPTIGGVIILGARLQLLSVKADMGQYLQNV